MVGILLFRTSASSCCCCSCRSFPARRPQRGALALLRAWALAAVAAVEPRGAAAAPPAGLAQRRREAFPLAVLLASIGTAWLSSLLGISMALGAFLGGPVLAESEFSHQAHAEIRPLRDMLAGLFFISLGMLVDLECSWRQLPI